MQSPQGNAEEGAKERLPESKEEVRGDEHDQAEQEEGFGSDPVLQPSGRIGARREDEAHNGNDCRGPRRRETFIVGANDQEGLAEPRQVNIAPAPTMSQ